MVFEKLQPWLTGDAAHGDQQELADSLGMNLNSLKSHIHRLKQRFRVLVRMEIAGTLNQGDFIEEEMSVLFATLRRNCVSWQPFISFTSGSRSFEQT